MVKLLSKRQTKQLLGLMPFILAVLLSLLVAVYPKLNNSHKKRVENVLVGKLNIVVTVGLLFLLFNENVLLLMLSLLFLLEVNMISVTREKEEFRSYFGLNKLPCDS